MPKRIPAYLILRRGKDIGSDLVEYRMDADGNPINRADLNLGYLVTSGFALSCNYFSTDFLPESTFRYLGSQKLGARDTYVVAFAQKPGEATHFVSLTERGGMSVNMLMQGIAWVDKNYFQIIRLRTDLLAPHPEIALERQTTEVTFSNVQFQDLATSLWLPEDVKVSLEVHNLRFHNEHHYTGYRLYRVSVKMLPPK